MNKRAGEAMEGPRAGRGKWSLAGVPHRGWTCVEIEDLGSPQRTCMMCEARKIRFVQHMEHPEYPDVLECGCVCAGHMEGDLSRARARERKSINAARCRMRFPHRSGWKVSRAGNPTITIDRLRVTVFPADQGFKSVIINIWNERRIWPPRIYPTVVAAKLAAFDCMLLDS